MKLPEKEVKRAEKVLKNDWRIEKMRFICRIFDKAGKNDLTSEDVVEAYHSDYGTMDDATILGLLKRMTDLKLLRRERRSVKAYSEGHVKVSNRYFYTATPQMWERMEELEKELMDMALGKEDKFKVVEKKEKRTRLEEMRPEHAPVVEEHTPKDDKTVSEIGRTVAEMMEQMPFSEALLKLYQGGRIVSAVSGNVYTMMDKDGKKGVTSSANPGAIISFFPAIEMEGKWREMELPKPCPFCGGQVKLAQYDNGSMFYYCCTNENCKSTGPKARTPEEAVKKFNKRC